MTHTNKTTQAIINLVTLIYGGFAVRINTSGIRNRKSRSKGHPDISGVFRSYSFMAEVKTGDDKLSPDQINFIDKYEDAGGKCFVVKDSLDFENQFKKYFKIK